MKAMVVHQAGEMLTGFGALRVVHDAKEEDNQPQKVVLIFSSPIILADPYLT